MTFVIKTHFQNFHLESEKLTAKLNDLDHDTGGRGQQNDEADHQPPLQEQGGLPQRAHLQRFELEGLSGRVGSHGKADQTNVP